MARYILDSQVFIWAHTAPKRLSSRARRFLSDEENTILLSTASVWELCYKHIIGKLEFPGEPEKFINRAISESAYHLLPLGLNHAFAQMRLPHLHRDPFDRMLICQSLAENAAIITADDQIQQYPVQTIW